MAIDHVHHPILEEVVPGSYRPYEGSSFWVWYTVEGDQIDDQTAEAEVSILYELVCRVGPPRTVVDAGILSVFILRPHGSAVHTNGRELKDARG
jgi:hypothetical protein